jgi:ribosome biogenesis GTPase
MTNFHALTALGWSPFFQQQLSLEEWSETIPVRVVEQHKSRVELTSGSEIFSLALHHNMPSLVVGDWLLLDKEKQFLRLLERKTCFRRKSAGTDVDWQLIAANVDTAFIVCSLNEDFNLSRIERYLSLAHAAEVDPLVVLTKSDLIADPQPWLQQINEMDNHLAAIAVNALSADCEEALADWLGAGKTVVILGSSGVGKSTLTNTLLGVHRQTTAGIREDDDKGRHTTTSRSLLALPNGGLILDTPGMRELQIADCQDGLAATFADIEKLAIDCRYSDCKHNGEPGCAVVNAITAGTLEPRRLKNYHKLMKEEALNSASLAERRANDKALGQFYKRTLADAYKLKGRD